MALTLSQICVNAEKTYQMKLIAGEDGMDNVVRWVHIIEDVEVSHFIEGQELVFTTGIAQHGVNWLMPYAEQLLRHGAGGLVVNLGPYIEKVPPQLIVWCNTHSFPLLVLPWSVHIIDVTYDFCHRIIQSEKHERSIASAFRTWIFNPEKGESYAGVLQYAGFQENGRYQVMLLHLQEKEHQLTDLEWEQLQFRVYRALRKTHLSVCIFRLEQSICLVGQNTWEKLRQYIEQVSRILSERGGCVLRNIRRTDRVSGIIGTVSSGKGCGCCLPDPKKTDAVLFRTGRISDPIRRKRPEDLRTVFRICAGRSGKIRCPKSYRLPGSAVPLSFCGVQRSADRRTDAGASEYHKL